MPSAVLVIGTLTGLYASFFIYALLRNIVNARQTGLPCIFVPVDQNHLAWMITSPPLRQTFERWLPDALYKRIALAIYGHESHLKLRPFREIAGPRGNDKSYMLVGCGALEIWTRDANLAAQILSRPKDFTQMELANLLLNKFGENLLSTNGEKWARQRKVVAGVINERISKAVFNESVRQTEGLLMGIQNQADHNGATETNQLFNWAKKITIHVLSGAGMGVSVSWEDKDTEKPKPGFKQTFIQSVQNVIDNMSGTILLPQWFLSNYPSFLPGQQNLSRLGVAVEEYPLHTKELLDNERQRVRMGGGASKSNILSQLIQASDSPVDADSKSSSGRETQTLTEAELHGNLFIFTAAGFDTTANTLSYALVLLARYPEWQNWLLEEVDEILPSDPESELDYASTFGKATRTVAFMLEVLRLFSPLIHIAKETHAPQVLHTPEHDIPLPPNTTVYLNVVCIHLDPDVWRNLNLPKNEPSSDDDENKFRPTRWINPPEAPQPLFNPPKGSFVPWSGGPRVCPGQKMAQVEFVAIFLTILRRHRIDAAAIGNESREQVNDRLDRRMQDSISKLTSQMQHVYDVAESDEAGLKLRISRRK